MARDSLTGTRIRDRRSVAGIRQADLARQIGISASYLNLIEHNRRRIGGKLLINIAQALGVEPALLIEGAEAALISTLREAAADLGPNLAEVDRVEDFAGRYPGWSEVLVRAQRRLAGMERTIETLSDRLTHDPHLAASLHEVLSTAAAIRSTASILAETGEIEPEWRDRFHRNLNQDSRRLAESSKELVRYLDDSDSGEDQRGVPREEAEAFMAAHGYHFAALETGDSTPESLIRAAPELTSQPARAIARGFLAQYVEDAARLPLRRIETAIADHGADLAALLPRIGVPLPVLLRRLATLPEGMLPGGAGAIVCDGSGSLLFRKPVAGFAMPRFGAPCPLWPVFTALSRPLVPVHRELVQVGRSSARFACTAIAWPEGEAGLEEDPLYRSVMLILPLPASDAAGDGHQQVGSSCRVCSRAACRARREPSILREEF
ncbi:MAG: transcriptional regulator [Pseudooceanicola sp.]|nr:transcriptional regulator [Pseudooceanicola sp.]